MRTDDIEQGWRRLLAKVITQAVKDAKGSRDSLAYDARNFLHSDGCGDLLNFFIRDFNPSMIDEVLLSGESLKGESNG